jgi:hypothetical protein
LASAACSRCNAGGKTDDGTPGGYRNRILGVVTLNAKHGTTIRARKFSGPVLAAGSAFLIAGTGLVLLLDALVRHARASRLASPAAAR